MQETPEADELLTELTALLPAAGAQPDVVSRRNGVLVVRAGDVIAKAHRAGTDEDALLVRLALANHPSLREILVAPLPAGEGHLVRRHQRLITLWPAGDPIEPGYTDNAPWAEAACLLARLHNLPAEDLLPGVALPPPGGPARVARAINRLRDVDGPATEVVRAAYDALPPEIDEPVPPARASLVHGDWHLGQLVWRAGTGRWLLIDVDDLGLGDPAWDLARPAAFFAAGLLPPEEWIRFFEAYREAGGPAVPGEGDPWPALDGPTRALIIQMAAVRVSQAHQAGQPLDEIGEELVATCHRMTRDH